MEQGDEITAKFRPRRSDDLRPGATDLIGQTLSWEAMWVIDSGPYTGEWAMAPNPRHPAFAWAPMSDLEEVAASEGHDPKTGSCYYCDCRKYRAPEESKNG